MAFDIDLGFASLAGRKDTNEDFCPATLLDAGRESMGSIVAIADGLSAGGMGQEAARTTVTRLARDYYCMPETWDTTLALDRIIGAQNVWPSGINRRRHPAMGLTMLTALVLCGQSYTLAHVGDSRANLLREDEMRQLTHDPAVNHPDLKHQLLRSVGAEDHVAVDYFQGELLVGDVFVLVTDGVHGVLRSPRLQELASGHATGGAALASQNMVDAALAAGSQDNVTAGVVRVTGLLQAGLSEFTLRAESLSVPPRPLKVGESIDGFTVTALVADGGINLLYQVRDNTSQALFALKTLHPARAHDGQERAVLAHEGWLAARMQSGRSANHLVHLHGQLPANRDRAASYLLYDWHSGETLQQLDRTGKLTAQLALAAASQTAHALGLLHRQCVVHRDIKPANLHQGKDGVLRLLDLGVALSGREPEAMRKLHAGTPSFVNPEQWGYSALGGTGPEELSDPPKRLVCSWCDAVPIVNRPTAVWLGAAVPGRPQLPRPDCLRANQPESADPAGPHRAQGSGP